MSQPDTAPAQEATPAPQYGLDAYVLRARVAPAVLIAAPALALGIALVPMLPGLTRLWSLLAFAIFPLAAAITRQLGITAQPRLYAAWGGPPATARLRWSDSLRRDVIARRHREARAVLGYSLPTTAGETRDPQAAEDAYTEAIRRLRGKTRDKHRFALLYKENVAYGFARNLYGGRRLGQLIAGGTLLATAAAATAIGQLTTFVNAVPLLLPGIVSLLALGLWPLITETTVRPPAEAYAERLMEALQTLATTHEA